MLKRRRKKSANIFFLFSFEMIPSLSWLFPIWGVWYRPIRCGKHLINWRQTFYHIPSPWNTITMQKEKIRNYHCYWNLTKLLDYVTWAAGYQWYFGLINHRIWIRIIRMAIVIKCWQKPNAFKSLIWSIPTHWYILDWFAMVRFGAPQTPDIHPRGLKRFDLIYIGGSLWKETKQIVFMWINLFVSQCWSISLMFPSLMMSQSTSAPKIWKVKSWPYYLCSPCGWF